MPDQPTTPQISASEGLWTIAVRWLSGQPFNNVLTAFLVVGIGFLSYRGAPALIQEWHASQEHFNMHIAARDAINEQQRKEFLAAIDKVEERCAKSIEREHGFAKEMLERIIVKFENKGKPAPDLIGPEAPATAKQTPGG